MDPYVIRLIAHFRLGVRLWIEDGIRICSLFGIINRIANALDFEVPPAADLQRTAGFLLRFGYRM